LRQDSFRALGGAHHKVEKIPRINPIKLAMNPVKNHIPYNRYCYCRFTTFQLTKQIKSTRQFISSNKSADNEVLAL
jgi:hypothetical protein